MRIVSIEELQEMADFFLQCYYNDSTYGDSTNEQRAWRLATELVIRRGDKIQEGE